MGINDCISALREVFVCLSALSCQKSTVQGQQNSSMRITTYCRNIWIKPKSSASENMEDIKRYRWAWMSGGCMSFSQQEWVQCHAKTTHLSINTLPTDGAVWHQKHDVIHVFWQKQIHCHLQLQSISRTKIHVCNNRTVKRDTECVLSWRLTWL